VKNRLFWRLFAAFTAAMLLTVAVSSFFMVAMVRAERQEALESEIMVQARDIALLLSENTAPGLGFFQREPVLGQGVVSKIISVREEYSATVWLVYSNGMAYTIGEEVISSEQLTSEPVLHELYQVLSGEEYERAKKKLFAVMTLQMTLPGVPCIFYGDEAGLYGHADPFCRKFYPWGRENAQLIRHYTALGQMRKNYASVFAGSTEELSPSNLKRRLTSFEYDDVLNFAISLGFDGFSQEKESAKKDFTPEFYK